MCRLIFFGFIIYLLIVAYKRSSIGKKNDGPNVNKDIPSKEGEIESMVQCASCQVHLPRSEAYLVNGAFYCSKLHIPK